MTDYSSSCSVCLCPRLPFLAPSGLNFAINSWHDDFDSHMNFTSNLAVGSTLGLESDFGAGLARGLLSRFLPQQADERERQLTQSSLSPSTAAIHGSAQVFQLCELVKHAWR